MRTLTESPAPDVHSTLVRLAAVGPSLWRVIDRSGRILGHLQTVADPRGVRYRARRFHVPSRAFLDVGDFWSPDDAVDTLRLAH